MPESTSLGAVSAFAALQHGVVTRSQAAALGVNKNAVARLKVSQFWQEPIPGVLALIGAAATWHQRAFVASQALGGCPIISHEAGARLHTCEEFGSEDRVIVTVCRGQRIRGCDVVIHQVAEAVDARDIVEIDGIRCTGLARTIVDLAAIMSPARLERLVDEFERRDASLRWLQDTAQRLNRPGFAGGRRVLDELARRQSRGRTLVRGSWFQKLVAECLSSPAIPDLREEFEVRSGAGELLARVDLAVPSVRLGIEAHSRRFHFGARAEHFDQERENRLAVEGWMLCYVGYADATRTPAQVRRHIEQLVSRRQLDLRAA